MCDKTAVHTICSMYILVKLLPAATVNQNQAHQLNFKGQTYPYMGCSASMFGSTFLCMHLMICAGIEKLNIHHIFAANPGLKTEQRYNKLLNGTRHFPFDAAAVKVKALTNQLMSVALVNHCKSGRQQGWDQNNGSDSQKMTSVSHQLPRRVCGKYKSHLITFNLDSRCKTGG